MIIALVSTAALLQASPGVPPRDAPKSAPNPPMICRTEQISGSRVGVFRVCMTKTNWELRALDAQAFVARFQQRSAIQQ